VISAPWYGEKILFKNITYLEWSVNENGELDLSEEEK
jgi:hypothetical protein